MLIHKIQKLYLNDTRYISNIEICIKQGEIVLLKGANGSGKTTIARSIIGLGNIKNIVETSIDGVSISELKVNERIHKGIYYSFQSPVAIKGVSLYSILRESYLNTNIEPKLDLIAFKKKILKYFDTLNLNPELLYRDINEKYSGGEMKKVELIFPLILESKHIILDEIDSGLDISSRKIVYGIVSEMKKENKGILLISHYDIEKYIKVDNVIDISNIKYLNE